MILSFINIRKVPREMLNVNEWKIMFDHYNGLNYSLCKCIAFCNQYFKEYCLTTAKRKKTKYYQ